MRRRVYTLLLLLGLLAAPAAAFDQTVISRFGGGTDITGTNNVFSGTNTFNAATTFGARILLPNGTTGAPSLSFTNVANLGIYTDQSGMVLQGPGAEKWFFNGNNLSSPAAGVIGWAQSSTPWDTVDLALSREAAAILQLGIDVNGAAVAQQIKAHDGITGTDIAGASLTIAGGRPTGAGIGGAIIHQTAPNGATGTTARALETRDYLHAGSKAVPDNTATAFVDIGVVTDDAGAVQVFYEVKTENATDQQVVSGVATVAYYNDAGTEACGAVVEAGETTAASTGTITATITCTVGLTDEVRLNMTSDTSLNTALTLKWRIIGGTIGAVQPQ